MRQQCSHIQTCQVDAESANSVGFFLALWLAAIWLKVILRNSICEKLKKKKLFTGTFQKKKVKSSEPQGHTFRSPQCPSLTTSVLDASWQLRRNNTNAAPSRLGRFEVWFCAWQLKQVEITPEGLIASS